MIPTESESIDTDIINDDEVDIILLTESDIPATQLNVSQLKRWLTCRGAPANRKKPELIQR